MYSVLCRRHSTCFFVLSVVPLFSTEMLNHLNLRVQTIHSELTTEKSDVCERRLQYVSHKTVCVSAVFMG
jgi:hypothetical protein